MKVALYARISTHDGRQNLENQLGELRQFVDGQVIQPPYTNDPWWKVTGEYTDQDSGANDRRPGLDKLLKDAGAGAFKLVLVWDLSRLTRGGPAKAFEYISRLKQYGVEVWSLKEPHFRTSGPAGDVFIALAAHIAREERRVMQERINAGISRARKAGKHFGRPWIRLDPARLIRYMEEGRSFREMAKLEKACIATVFRRCHQLKGTTPKPKEKKTA